MTLDAAIEIFRELGWADGELADVMTLPLGTPEQRRIAKAGLAKGEWGAIVQLSENSWGWRSSINVDNDLLGAFAVRVGVSARRAAEVFPRGLSPRTQGEMLAERGADFVSAFVNGGRRALWESSGIVYAMALTGSETPAEPEFLERWANIAVGAMGEEGEVPAEIVGARYRESLTALLQGTIPTRFDAAALVGGGVARGWIPRDEARELVLFAMDRAPRPSDRVTWSRVLVGTLEAPEEWLLEHAPVLVSTMSFGDDAVITAFVPVLLAAGDDELTMQALFAGLAAKSAKAKAAVLAATLEARVPGPEVAQLLGDQVAALAGAKDRRVAGNATAVMAAWGISAQREPAAAPEKPRGLWHPTPAIAEVPRFDAGPATSERVTQLASVLLAEEGEPRALEVERFLASANALARTDADAARTALRGVRQTWVRGLVGVYPWVKGTEFPSADREGVTQGPYLARDTTVFQGLGSVPVLLSTPTWDDFRIDPADLAARLDEYRDVAVLEADLQIALPRIDLALVTPELARRLGSFRQAIELQSGGKLAATVGDILDSWIREPAVYPDRSEDQWATVAAVPAIAKLPPRLRLSYGAVDVTIFPAHPEAEFPSGDSRVAAMRSVPNGVAPSSALLDNVGEGSADPDAAIAAWERGVLVPGVASAQALVWRGAVTSIAARADGWAYLAEAGMLSVVWPLAVDVVAVSSGGARVAPGVADLVEMLARFLPEVELAVANGIAPPESLALDPVRALAERGGSSAAVRAARDLVARLPEAARPAAPVATEMSDEDFARVWTRSADPDPVDDGATFAIEMAQTTRGAFPLLAVTLPGGEVVRTERMSWLYPLVHEAQIPVTDASGDERWFRCEGGRAVLAATRPDSGEARAVSRTLVATLLVTQMSKTPETHYLHEAATRGIVGPRSVADAARVLLVDDAFDPHKALRILRSAPEMLSSLWPIVTMAIETGAARAKSPAWLVRVIDVAIENSDGLRAAMRRGLVPGMWEGLAEVAESSTSAAARRKAVLLRDALGV